MKTRIISAAILVPVLLLIVLVAPKILAALLMAAMFAIAAYELLYRTRLVRQPRLVLYSCGMAVAVTLWSCWGAPHAWLVLLMMVFWGLLFMEMMLDHIKVRIESLGLCFLAGAIVPYFLSAMVRILTMSIGRYVVLIPFVVAFLSDSGAYFVGLKFGHHKLAPVVSPNKTIEGAVGGVVTCMLSMVLYALIVSFIPGVKVNYLLAMVYGLVGALVDIFGDLSFSIIKRQTGIKDYGNLIPGHGGILDRFDSMVMVAPLIEALLNLAPMVTVV